MWAFASRDDQMYECEHMPFHLLRPPGCSSIFMSALSESTETNNWSKNEENIILGWSTSNNVQVLLNIKSFAFKTFIFWNSLKEHKWQHSLKYQTFNISKAKRILQGEIECFLGKLWTISILKESWHSHFLHTYKHSVVCDYSCIEMKKRVDDYQVCFIYVNGQNR